MTSKLKKTAAILLLLYIPPQGACFSLLLPPSIRKPGWRPSSTVLPIPTDEDRGRSSLRLGMVLDVPDIIIAPLSVSSPTVAKAAELGGFPALAMLVFSVGGLFIEAPPAVVGALQHLAAGILLSTVAKELLPEMVNANGLQENLASGVGFFSGVAVLLLLGILLPEAEEPVLESGEVYETKKGETRANLSTTMPIPSLPSLGNRRRSLKGEAFACCGMQTDECFEKGNEKGADLVVDTTTGLQEDENQLVYTEETSIIPKTTMVPTALPTALLTAIAIDATLDGLLIGIATAVGPSTGPMLSASLAVESSFLGLTLATALRGRNRASSAVLLASAVGPTGLLTGAVLGGGLAPTLMDSSVLLAGLLGFGTSALLFMVAEELLLEAHEDGAEHIWWVDLQLYTGFFASVMVDKFVVV